MAKQSAKTTMITVTPVADGLAYVYGRVATDASGARGWEYLGSSVSREDALERARRTALGGEVHIDGAGSGGDRARVAVSDPSGEGIAPTRPPADS